MEIINVDQRSEEWFKLREKRMTASHAQAIAANGKGLQSYIHKMMTEYFSKAEPERYSNEAMERGIELEESAAFMYQAKRGVEVEKIGFVIHNDYVGCSPDGFVYDETGVLKKDRSGMVEIKCPQDPEYFRLLLGGSIKPEYIAQMNMQMKICGRSWCDFVAYNPNFDVELIVTRVYPDQKIIDKLDAGIKTGIELIQDIESQMSNLK